MFYEAIVIVKTRIMYNPAIVRIGPPMFIIHQIGENGLILYFFIFYSCLIVTFLNTVTVCFFCFVESANCCKCLCIIGFSAISYSGIALNYEIYWLM